MASLQRKFADLVYLIGGRNKRRGRPSTAPSIIGSQDAILPGGRPHRHNQKLFDLPEPILRPIMLDLSISSEICEMMIWCSEISGALTILSQNIFQAEDGRIDSWSIKTKDQFGKPLENAPHPDIVSIANDIQHRCVGDKYILGAQRLEYAAFQTFGSGDCFMEMAIAPSGLGKNDYEICDSIYLPTWSTFIQSDEAGRIEQYRQQARLSPSGDDRVWDGVNLAKILHFKYKGDNTRYGWSGIFPQIEFWRKYKINSSNTEEAAANCLNPLIHEMPPDRPAEYKQAYRSEYEALMDNSSIVTNLYLEHGAVVKRAEAPTPTLTPLLNYHMQLRYGLVPSGCPLWLLPGLTLESGSAKDLSGQPALTYARLIAHLRSILAEKIKFAIGVEVTMKKGYSFWAEHSRNVMIEWPSWITQEVPGLQTGSQKPVEQQEEEAKEKFIHLNGDKAKQLFG